MIRTIFAGDVVLYCSLVVLFLKFVDSSRSFRSLKEKRVLCRMRKGFYNQGVEAVRELRTDRLVSPHCVCLTIMKFCDDQKNVDDKNYCANPKFPVR